jgi:hypothetical protein
VRTKNQALIACALMPIAAFGADREWQFKVFLDDKEIGVHSFALEDRGAERRIEIAADFEYKLLFLTLFEYSHRNTEVWSGDCLQAIEAKTVSNGESSEFTARRTSNDFRPPTADTDAHLPPCVMSFAYWNPSFLDQDRLLDPQTGQLLDVAISQPQPDQLLVKGAPVNARHYRLKGDGLRISLWYSEDDEWLGLEADAVGGRTLRYELM